MSIIRRKGFLLITEQEMLLFIKELGSLLRDYKKCNEELLRQEIHKDILLLSAVIYDGKGDTH